MTPAPADAGVAASGPSAPGDQLPSAEQVQTAMSDVVVPAMKGVAKAIFSGGRVIEVGPKGAVYALAMGAPLDRAERSRSDVEAALRSHLGRDVPLRLIDDADAGADRAAPQISGGAVDLTDAAADADDLTIDVADLEDADVAETGIDRLTRAFPGAVVIQEDEVVQ